MSIIGKRKCSFKPTTSVKVMLTEIEALITALDYDLNLEEIINAALKKYLPPFLISLRSAASRKQDEIILKALKETEKILKKEENRQLFDFDLNINKLKQQVNNSRDEKDMDVEEEDCEEDDNNIEEITVNPSVFDRFM